MSEQILVVAIICGIPIILLLSKLVAVIGPKINQWLGEE